MKRFLISLALAATMFAGVLAFMPKDVESQIGYTKTFSTFTAGTADFDLVDDDFFVGFGTDSDFRLEYVSASDQFDIKDDNDAQVVEFMDFPGVVADYADLFMVNVGAAGTVAIMDGSDDYTFFQVEITNANHTGASNVIKAFEAILDTPDDQATETAFYSDNWDIDLNMVAGGDFLTRIVSDSTFRLEMGATSSLRIFDTGSVAEFNNFPDAVGDYSDLQMVDIGNGRTIANMDGSDDYSVFEINFVNGNHTGVSNILNALEIVAITGDADADEIGILVGSGFDNSISVAAGTVGEPAIVFTDDDDGTGTGMYRVSADSIGFTANGTQVLRVLTNGLRGVSGTAANPTYTMITQSNLGMYRVGADNLGFSVGALVFDIEDTNAAGAGANLATISATTGIMDNSDTVNGLSIDITSADHTGAGNIITALNIGVIVADAETAETPIVIGPGWESVFEWEGTDDTEEFTLAVVDPTADITVQFRDDSAGTYNILVTPNADVTVGDFFNPFAQVLDGVAASANTTDDVMLVQRFYLPYPITVITVDIINIDSANASAGDNTISVAFYEDADAGAQITETIGVTDDGAGGFNGAYSINITDTTFEPGWYRIAFCAQDASDNDIVIQTANGNIEFVLGAGTGEFLGQGANPCVAGDPPTTTGAISQADGELVPFLLTTN